MKKMILSAVVCVMLLLGSIVAYELYMNWLAGSLFVLTLIPTGLFAEGRKEYINKA